MKKQMKIVSTEDDLIKTSAQRQERIVMTSGNFSPRSNTEFDPKNRFDFPRVKQNANGIEIKLMFNDTTVPNRYVLK